MTPKFRWGILGAGAIARKFASDLKRLPDAECYAVGSRSQEKANTFAQEFGMPVAYGSYEALIADANVDAIYVATPHPFHKEHSIACLQAGKPVLCEKPFAINAGEVQAMIDASRAANTFLMEAMWTRFLPVNLKVCQWIAEGKIGEPRFLLADFGFRSGINPQGRLFNPELGGGALLDVGIYPISYASMIFDAQPNKIFAAGELGDTGVDYQTSLLFTYRNGANAMLRTAIRVNTEQRARIEGTEGAIDVPDFWHATRASLFVNGKLEETIEGESGYHFEAAEVMRCVREGKTESAHLPLKESLAIVQTMDEIRKQIGLSYPMEA